MAYNFQTERVASFQLDAYILSGNKQTFKGVDGTQSDANTIVGGIQQLLDIVGFVDRYDPTDAKRTIDERIVES